MQCIVHTPCKNQKNTDQKINFPFVAKEQVPASQQKYVMLPVS